MAVTCLICCTPARDDDRNLNNYPDELKKINRDPKDETQFYDRQNFNNLEYFKTVKERYAYLMIVLVSGHAKFNSGYQVRELNLEVKKTTYLDPWYDTALPIKFEEMSDDFKFYIEFFEKIEKKEEEEEAEKEKDAQVATTTKLEKEKKND